METFITTTETLERFGFNPENVFGLVVDSYIIDSQNIRRKEKEMNIPLGSLCIETLHGEFFEGEAKNYNFFTSYVEMGTRYYFFRPMKVNHAT